MLENKGIELVNQSINEFTTELEVKKIKLWVEGESLRYKAPVGVVTKDVLKSLGDRKAELIDYLKIKNASEIFYAPINKVEEMRYYPLSSAQLRMLFLSKLDSDSTAYNLTQALKINGEFNIDQLKEVLIQLIARHEALRTSFEMVGGKPVQEIHDSVDFNVDFQEIENTKESIDRTIKDFIKPYDLAKTPLFRFKLVRLVNSDNKPLYILIQDMHHIISDGVSEALLVHEVNELFLGKCLPELKIQYKDYADWHQKLLSSNEIQRQRQYWLEKLKTDIPLLNLPTDYARPQAFSFKGNSIKFKIEKPMADKLYNLERENRVTLFTLLLASYSILLSRYTGQNDIIIGTPTAGRRHADINNTIGVFVNTLALRISYTPECEFDEFLRSLGHEVVQDFDNQDYPFEYFLEDLIITRDLSRNPIFDTMFILQNMNTDEIKVDELEISNYDFDKGMAQVDISLIGIQKKDGIDIEINYCTSLFKEETINKFGEHFINILKYLIEHPKAKLHEIDMLSDVEKSQLLYEFNNTEVQYPKDKTVQELIEEQVIKTPDNIAAIFENKELTYSELNKKANRLGRTLREKGVKGDSIVAIITDRSLEMIVGIMAVLKAGGAYLPISPEYPGERIKYMLEDSGACILLAQNSEMWEQKPELGELSVVRMSLEDESLYSVEDTNLEIINTPKNLAYIIYTSGSTGKPKGAMIEHYSLVNRLNWMQKKYPIGEGDTILQKTPYTFDVSVWEMFWWSMQGAKVCFLKPGGEKDPGAMLEVIEQKHITTMHFVPSMLTAFLAYVDNGIDISRLNSLRQVFASGEALNVQQVNKFNKMLYEKNGTKLHNLYGPTEATVDVSYFDCSTGEDFEIIPIGKPIDNINLFILSSEEKLQPIGVPGELFIAGDGLARGYLNRPELTAERFIANPFGNITGEKMYKTGDLARWLPDGNIEYLGRIDNQVKVRGFRIELGEIENQLLKSELIKEAVVLAKENEDGSKYLCAYYVADNEISIQLLRDVLSNELPDYMIPSYFIKLDQIPLSVNGKLDKKALPDFEGKVNTGTVYVEPRNKIEKKLVEAWKEVLCIDNEIGIYENFFELGGTSLNAIQVIGKIEGFSLNMGHIMKYPTIAELSKHAVVEVSNHIDLPDDMKENLDIEYDYLKNGSLEPITELLDCNTRMLYFVLKKKVKDFQNYYNILFNGFVFYIIQNEDGTIYNIDCTTYPIREDIFSIKTYSNKGMQAMVEVESFLNKGEIVIIDTLKFRVPFNKDFISKEYICELEPSVMGHTFVAIAHDKDNLYYVEMPSEINEKNYIPYSENKSVGIINKKELLPAFEVYANFGVVDINYSNLEKKSQFKENIEKILFEYYTQGITYEDGRRVFYGINAIDLLIDLSKQEILDLNGRNSFYREDNLRKLIGWKFWITAVRRKFLQIILETYSEQCNIEIKEELIILLGDLQLEWYRVSDFMTERFNENRFVIGKEYIPYFESLKKNELKLIDNLNKLWK